MNMKIMEIVVVIYDRKMFKFLLNYMYSYNMNDEKNTVKFMDYYNDYI